MRFTPLNWAFNQFVIVTANTSYVPGTGDTQVQNFALQPHTLDQMFGPLLVDGGQIEDRSLKQGVRLPTEIDSPLPVLTISVDESQSTDTLNIYDDGSVLSTTDGVLSTIDSTEASALDGVYKTTVDQSAFGHLVGLGLGDQDLHFGATTFEQGITYHQMEVVNLLLGQGDDTFHITGTPTNSLAVVQGGGGNDTLIATGGGGPNSPLILLGDTTQDGSFYNTTVSTPQTQRQGRDFIADSSSGGFGNDVIDASADPYVVSEYGGPGNDTPLRRRRQRRPRRRLGRRHDLRQRRQRPDLRRRRPEPRPVALDPDRDEPDRDDRRRTGRGTESTPATRSSRATTTCTAATAPTTCSATSASSRRRPARSG